MVNWVAHWYSDIHVYDVCISLIIVNWVAHCYSDIQMYDIIEYSELGGSLV